MEGQEADQEKTDTRWSQVLGPHLVSDIIHPGIGHPVYTDSSPGLGPEMKDSLILANGIRILGHQKSCCFGLPKVYWGDLMT